MELSYGYFVLKGVMNRTERKNITLVDDNVICREALKLLFNRTSDFKVCAEFSTFKELEANKDLIRTDLIFLSYSLPFEMIARVTEFLKDLHPGIPTILYNAGKADEIVLQCVMNGVKGIVWKTDSTGELLFVCQKILRGERYLGNIEAEFNLPGEVQTRDLRQHIHLLERISERELSVLKRFARGYSYKKIGEELNISPRTVESHKNNILAKLGLGSLKELISYVIKNNVV